MKSLQKLLLAIAFVSIMPSAELLCSEKSIELTVITPEDKKKFKQNLFESQKNLSKIYLNLAATVFGSYGAIAGAQGSHSLKKIKRNLTKASTMTPETLAQLNKGIKNNRIVMGASLAAVAFPVVRGKFERMNRKVDTEFTQETV